ncbi:MAG: DUF2970 domain-containing protein [Pigmentiphaga sp.]
MNDDRNATRRKANFGQTVKAVLWGMIGIRKGQGYHDDSSKINPVHLIIAVILATAIFVAVLIMIVRWAAG